MKIEKLQFLFVLMSAHYLLVEICELIQINLRCILKGGANMPKKLSQLLNVSFFLTILLSGVLRLVKDWEKIKKGILDTFAIEIEFQLLSIGEKIYITLRKIPFCFPAA